jgi:hypothetical protein
MVSANNQDTKGRRLSFVTTANKSPDNDDTKKRRLAFVTTAKQSSDNDETAHPNMIARTDTPAKGVIKGLAILNKPSPTNAIAIASKTMASSSAIRNKSRIPASAGGAPRTAADRLKIDSLTHTPKVLNFRMG